MAYLNKSVYLTHYNTTDLSQLKMVNFVFKQKSELHCFIYFFTTAISSIVSKVE